jgi:copper(I)-binding protein
LSGKVDEVKRTVLKSNPIGSNRENSVFQLFFLINNENQDIKVVEVRRIDLTEVKKHLEKGESVFITHKRKQKLEPISVASEETVEPWCFTHL